MSAEVEEWRDVVGWEGLYEVSSSGRVRSLEREVLCLNSRGLRAPRRYKSMLRKQQINPANGYQTVRLSRDGEQVTREVHALVCEAFHGPRPPGSLATHQDGRRSNNRADNLRWGTQKDNMADAARHGTLNAGIRHGMARLSIDQVRMIRDATGSQANIAQRFGVSRSHVGAIRRGRYRARQGYP